MKQLYTAFRLPRRLALTALMALGVGTAATQAQTANTAIQFNGSTKYGNTATAINLSGTALSLECWFKVTAFKTASPFITSIIGMETGSNIALLRCGDVGQPANQLQFVLQVGTLSYKVSSLTPLIAGTWYHVAGTFDGTTMRLYLNGVLDGSFSAAGSAVANSVLSFGRNYEDARILNGAIDEVRVWNRVLTAAEILANRCQVPTAPTGLQGLWRFDEGTGTTAADQSSNARNVTLTNVVNTDWTTATPTQCVRLATTGAANTVAGLQVVPTENPITGTSAAVELRGMAGQTVALQVLNNLGQVVSSQELKATSATQAATVSLPQAAGLYVVRATSSAGIATAKIVKQ